MTKRTSTWIAVAIVAMAILLAYNFYLLNKTQTASDEKAATVKPFYTMTRIQYVEKKLATKKDELESRTYEVVFNDKGHFRTEVVDGPSKGSLAIWNGTMFREYDATGKLVNETKAAKVSVRRAHSSHVASTNRSSPSSTKVTLDKSREKRTSPEWQRTCM